MMTSSEIRSKFLEFFQSKGHQIVPSAPIVVKNDPTLMFTNAGMNQFKDYFLGNKPAPWARVADTQKCLRVSGKHNDLEEVGVDTYHHTMFEMLGNWSFGDYFKKEAIEWSWELLTKVYGLPADRLYVTVFEGDAEQGVPKDEEAATEWAKWIAPERILLGNKKDNFWEMGDTGPCGPCTEIHFDSRPDAERSSVAGATLVNADHPQVIEIWNNVFIQFNRLKDKSLQPLPARHVDTGMGFERLVRVIQGKTSNYDTDVFGITMASITDITGKAYTGTDNKQDVAIRVLADHIRAISFTIADGQLPSNTGAGYVIRRILRRAVRYYYSYLGYQQPLLHQLVPVLADQFKDVFAELVNQQDFVARVIREEEEAFLRTLDKGLKRIEDLLRNDVVAGKDAFELYDTYGFPLDLTRLIASERGKTVDEVEFQTEMQKQKERSRAATAIDAGDWTILNEGSNRFTGYDSLEETTRLLRYRKVSAKGKDMYQLVLETTPFYAESGGQTGDTGLLQFGEEKIAVRDTRRENDLILHITDTIPAAPESELRAKVNKDRRKNTALNHSATHLMHAALRQVLGTHVAQKGSLVNGDYLRFDFSHFSKVTDEEIRKIEQIVNQKIRENIPVVIKSMPREEAMKTGAMALFGEKYGDVVRVVTIDPSYSVELCGGTHVNSTGELGQFIITSESAVAAGVRRIEALTGIAAENYLNEQRDQLKAVRELFKNPKDLSKALEQLQAENNTLRKEVEANEQRRYSAIAADLSNKVEDINGTRFIGVHADDVGMDGLKKIATDLKARSAAEVLAIVAALDGKASVLIQLEEAAAARLGLDAGKLIKEKVAPLIKGGGGGQKLLATAGGQDASRLRDVLVEIRSLL